MIRDISKILEKATIMEDRIDYANWILKEDKTQNLFDSLKLLLDSEATTVNIQNIKEFVEDNEDEIHQFDIKAMDKTFSSDQIHERVSC